MKDFMVHWLNVLLFIIALALFVAVMVLMVGSMVALVFWDLPYPRPWWLYVGAGFSIVTLIAALTYDGR